MSQQPALSTHLDRQAHLDEASVRLAADHRLYGIAAALQHSEGVERVVIESRQAGDAHDVRVRDHLRRSRQISAALRINHIGKHGGDPLVWIPDFIMGAYIAAEHHQQCEPWNILTDAHIIDVVNKP